METRIIPSHVSSQSPLSAGIVCAPTILAFLSFFNNQLCFLSRHRLSHLPVSLWNTLPGSLWPGRLLLGCHITTQSLLPAWLGVFPIYAFRGPSQSGHFIFLCFFNHSLFISMHHEDQMILCTTVPSLSNIELDMCLLQQMYLCLALNTEPSTQESFKCFWKGDWAHALWMFWCLF